LYYVQILITFLVCIRVILQKKTRMWTNTASTCSLLSAHIFCCPGRRCARSG